MPVMQINSYSGSRICFIARVTVKNGESFPCFRAHSRIRAGNACAIATECGDPNRLWFLKVTLGVLYAAAVRTYKNAKGEGRVGSIVLMDSSGDIKGTFFNDECDRWMETLKVNQVYKITGGNAKPADARYNNCKSTFEITFNRDSTFEPLSDADAPRVVYDFMNIEMMEQKEAGTIIDVLGIVQVD
jgi:ssDNA-binding replication factor A large subunit